MASPHFASLVDEIARAFGAGGKQLKETPEALYLRTPDGLLYAFFEDATRLTPKLVERLVASSSEDLSRLVVLALSVPPPGVVEILSEAGASVVVGERFLQLLEGLELTGRLGDGAAAPPSPPAEGDRRVLPTADRLDRTMEKGRYWMQIRVPAIAARFFDEAVRLKPEYVPALLGKGTALLALGSADAAEEAFDDALAQAPGDEEARIGLARVTGLRGDPEGEVDELRALLKEDPARVRVRAHLVAALAPQSRWKEMQEHVEELVTLAPQEPYFHALVSVCREQQGDKTGAAREKRAADALGMTPALWTTLREGLSPPPGPRGKGKGKARSSSGEGGPPSGLSWDGASPSGKKG